MMMIWSRLESRSRRCMERRYKRRVKPGQSNLYVYRPRGDLLERLKCELGLTYEEILREIRRERIIVLRQLGYTVGDNELV